MLLCTAGAGNRSAPPSRLALSANFFPISGKLYWLFVFCRWASNAARWRVRAMRRRSRARVARLVAG
jgi:hypothetical protein